jgi:predicted PurR-regulated permease PerM
MIHPPLDSSGDAERDRAANARAHPVPAEARALGVIAGLAALTLLWILLPVGVGVLLGTLLAFTAYRPYRWLVRKTARPALSSLAVTGIATAVVAGTLATLGYLTVLQGVSFFGALPGSFAPGGTAARLVEELAKPLALVKIQPSDIVDKLRSAVGGIASSLARWTASLVGVVFDGILALFFLAITMFFVLVHWSEIALRAERLMPINPRHTRRLMRSLHRLGRQTIVGNFGTAILQGVIAGVGFAIVRLPGAAFFGAMTAVASLIPLFGTPLIWAPATLILFAQGRAGAGFFELAWSVLLVVGFCDYVVRPRVVGGGASTSTWMTFVALFGGVKIFGFIGFLLGPLLVGVASDALRLYERTRRFRLGSTGDGPRRGPGA